MREKEKGEEMKGIKVLLMAGGRGERFWPKSRASMPKQFLNLYGKDSLLQQAFWASNHSEMRYFWITKRVSSFD